jgi:hypothetical protein
LIFPSFLKNIFMNIRFWIARAYFLNYLFI